MIRICSRACACTRRAQHGFTLYDAAVTIGLIGALSLGAVQMQNFVHGTRLTAQSNLLLTHLALARTEAITRRRPFTLCQSRNGTDCTRGRDWHEGWIMFVDENANQRRETGEMIIRIQQSLNAPYTLTFDGALNKDHYITFRPTGAGYPNGVFTLCSASGAQKPKGVTLLGTGRARTSDRKSNGKPLECPGES